MTLSQSNVQPRILTVSEPDDALEAVRDLFQEYHRYLGIDLSHQHFDDELAALPGKYAPPSGRLFLAQVQTTSIQITPEESSLDHSNLISASLSDSETISNQPCYYPAGCVAFYDFRAAHPAYTEADWLRWQIPQGRVCELKRLYVSPAYQGSGLGRRLFEHAMVEARTAGYDWMLLDSLRRLDSAMKLYLANGFAERAPYNADPQPDVYYMEKRLGIE